MKLAMRKYASLLIILPLLGSCARVYYGFWTAMGKNKREILKSQMSQIADEQEDISQTLSNNVLNINKKADKLLIETDEKLYQRLSNELQVLRIKNGRLKNQMSRVQLVGRDLFNQIRLDLLNTTDKQVYRKKIENLRQLQAKYKVMNRRMQKVQKDLFAVIAIYEDKTQHLRHNLQALVKSNLSFKNLEGQASSAKTQLKLFNYEAKDFSAQL